MKAIYKSPGGAPEIIDIHNTLEALQEKVGGYIETVTFTEDACVICNEEGRLMGMPFNLTFLGRSFVGPVLIVGVDVDDFTDIPQEAQDLVWPLLQSPPDTVYMRCCMCPNQTESKQAKQICPGIPGTPHPEPSPCRFVKAYIDERGWKYQVMSGLGESNYKARYQRPEKHGDVGWKGLNSVPWRKTFDEAQADLDQLAEKKGWKVWNG